MCVCQFIEFYSRGILFDFPKKLVTPLIIEPQRSADVKCLRRGEVESLRFEKPYLMTRGFCGGCAFN